MNERKNTKKAEGRPKHPQQGSEHDGWFGLWRIMSEVLLGPMPVADTSEVEPPDTLPADFFAENAPPATQPEPPAEGIEESHPDSSEWVN